jgi:hypothetical protein
MNEQQVSTAESLIICGPRDLVGMELSGIELRQELPRAVPVTQKCDGMYYLIALQFDTAAEAEHFASGLEEHCDRDDTRLFLKRPPTITRDECGNCSGVN